jgi:hypothetical protein
MFPPPQPTTNCRGKGAIAVSLQSGSLQSLATEFGSGNPLDGLGAYSLGLPILDLEIHSLD